MTSAQPNGTSYDVKMIPLAYIAENPLNPRKTFVDMEDLIADVRQRGVLQPVLVRPNPQNGTEFYYELVFGARRFRAAREAGLEAIPAMVRTLDDAETLEIMLVENCRRADVHPLEEADAYRRLNEQYGLSVEAIGERVSKSKAYVYARMKLCSLVEPARKLFREELLNPSTALLVARVPPDLQAKAAEAIARPRRLGLGLGAPSGPLSYREAAELLQADFMLRLSAAPFSKADASLVPAAGPCTQCPKRTGNDRELYPDVKSADVCTDPKCYRAKLDAHFDRRVVEAEAEGSQRVVLSQAKAKGLFHEGSHDLRYGAGYVAADQACYDGSARGKPFRQVLKKAEIPILVTQAPDGQTVELYELKAAQKALRALGVVRPQKRAAATDAASPRAKADSKARELRRKVAPLAIGRIVDWSSAPENALAAMRLIALLALREIRDVAAMDPEALEAIAKRRGVPGRALEAWIEKAGIPKARAFALEVLLGPPSLEQLEGNHGPGEYPLDLRRAAKAAGLDLGKLEAGFEAAAAEASAPAKPAPAAKARKSARSRRK